MPTFNCQALDFPFEVQVVGKDPVLARMLAPLLGSDSPRVSYRMRVPDAGVPGSLDVDGSTMAMYDDLVPLRQLLVTLVGRGVVDSLDRPWIHACLVEFEGIGILIVGNSGSGKSTLSSRLLQKGGRLVAEDICALNGASCIRSYHRPLALSPSGLRLIGLDHEADCDCGKVLVAPQQVGSSFSSGATVGMLAFVDRHSASIAPLSPADAFARLVRDTVGGIGQPTRDLRAIAEMCASARNLAVGSASLDGAADHLISALTPPTDLIDLELELMNDDAVCARFGTQGVVWRNQQVHSLNSTSLAVWLLHHDGLAPIAIAKQMGCGAGLVRDALGLLGDEGLLTQ